MVPHKRAKPPWIRMNQFMSNGGRAASHDTCMELRMTVRSSMHVFGVPPWKFVRYGVGSCLIVSHYA